MSETRFKTSRGRSMSDYVRTSLRSHRRNILRWVSERFLQALRGWLKPTFESLVRVVQGIPDPNQIRRYEMAVR
jgi:hypothetical protein